MGIESATAIGPWTWNTWPACHELSVRVQRVICIKDFLNMNGLDSALNIQQLIDSLDQEESLELEFKAAQGGLPETLWETVSAFSNTAGGRIILGVIENTDSSLTLQGVSNPGNLVDLFFRQVRNPQKISHPVCGPNDVRIESVGTARLVVIRVPAAGRSARPVFIRNNPYTGTYVRNNSGDFHCRKEEVDRMMREASSLAADRVIVDWATLRDLDMDAVQRYRNRFQTANPGSPWTGYDDDQFLLAVGARRHDREAGNQGITVAGLLMFGAPAAIREWRGRHLIDFRIASEDPSPLGRTGWQDRIDWEGHLFGAFETIYPRLVSGLPAPLRFDGAWRSGDRPWQVALREALVNLLVHADYADQAPSLILRSDTECVFRNPGSSRVPELGPLTRDRSDPRNPEIFRMFRLIGLAEEAGSGVPRIYAAWQELGLLPPEIDLGIDRNEFTLELRYLHLLSDEDRAWLSEILDRANEPEQLALVIALREGSVDNRTLREVTSQHPVDATATLGRLRDEGYLRLIGYGRGARYELDPLLPRPRTGGESGDIGTGMVPEPAVGVQQRQIPMSDSHMLGPQSDMPIRESMNIRESETSTSIVPKSASVTKRDSAISLVLDSIWDTLEATAQPVSSTDYVSSLTRDEVIVALCSTQELSLLELSWLLNRKKEYLRTVVGALIRSGKLTYSIPKQPRHPEQRYRASTGEEK
jgi:ATP-dependent DNA helicase RecG